jgi:hypothetical protein
MQALAVSLVYSCEEKEKGIEVAMMAFEPRLDGNQEQVSEVMITGSGVGLNLTLLPLKTA